MLDTKFDYKKYGQLSEKTEILIEYKIKQQRETSWRYSLGSDVKTFSCALAYARYMINEDAKKLEAPIKRKILEKETFFKYVNFEDGRFYKEGSKEYNEYLKLYKSNTVPSLIARVNSYYKDAVDKYKYKDNFLNRIPIPEWFFCNLFCVFIFLFTKIDGIIHPWQLIAIAAAFLAIVPVYRLRRNKFGPYVKKKKKVMEYIYEYQVSEYKRSTETYKEKSFEYNTALREIEGLIRAISASDQRAFPVNYINSLDSIKFYRYNLTKPDQNIDALKKMREHEETMRSFEPQPYYRNPNVKTQNYNNNYNESAPQYNTQDDNSYDYGKEDELIFRTAMGQDPTEAYYDTYLPGVYEHH